MKHCAFRTEFLKETLTALDDENTTRDLIAVLSQGFLVVWTLPCDKRIQHSNFDHMSPVSKPFYDENTDRVGKWSTMSFYRART